MNIPILNDMFLRERRVGCGVQKYRLQRRITLYERLPFRTKLLAVVFHCYVDVVLRDAKRFYVPDADKQRKKFDKIISHETHLL